MTMLILAIVSAFFSTASFVVMLFYVLPVVEELDPRKPPRSAKGAGK